MRARFSWFGLVGAGCLAMFAGCSDDNTGSGAADAGSDHGALLDLTGLPLPDLLVDDEAGAAFYRYALNRLVLPQESLSYAIDLNGDGRRDNALGNIIGALANVGLDTQMQVDYSIAHGEVVELLRMQSRDPSLSDDDAVPVVIFPGAPTAMPDFTGTGEFLVDDQQPASNFRGKLVGGKYASENPVTTMQPVALTLRIPLPIGNQPLTLPLNGVHIQFKPGTDANSRAPGLVDGEMHGSVRDSDVKGTVLPGLATMLDQVVQLDPTSPNARQILALFDTGGCMGAKAGDGRIDACEVAGNVLIQTLFAPDVQIYDANGNYAPNPRNTTRNALSVGVAFTAVKASF